MVKIMFIFKSLSELLLLMGNNVILPAAWLLNISETLAKSFGPFCSYLGFSHASDLHLTLQLTQSALRPYNWCE